MATREEKGQNQQETQLLTLGLMQKKNRKVALGPKEQEDLRKGQMFARKDFKLMGIQS